MVHFSVSVTRFMRQIFQYLFVEIQGRWNLTLPRATTTSAQWELKNNL